MPEPDILVNNNAGPPFRDFREIDRQKMLEGVTANMVVAIELIQKVVEPMSKKKFGRIVNITSGSVKMPIGGLDLSSGARAGLTAFLCGVARQVAPNGITINFLLPGSFETDRLNHNMETVAKNQNITVEQAKAARVATRAGETLRLSGRVRRGLRVPVLGACRLHHRAEPADRRRRVSRRVLIAQCHSGARATAREPGSHKPDTLDGSLDRAARHVRGYGFRAPALAAPE